MDKLRQTAQQALEALEHVWNTTSDDDSVVDAAIADLRTALQNEFNPDWDRVEALRESLREHMADVRRLRAALGWIAAHKSSDWPEHCQKMVDKAREALAEQPAQQEPVAWMYFDSDGDAIFGHPNGYRPDDAVPVYTAPQPAMPSDDTMYLLRRLLSNQHTLTGPELRQELAKIVEGHYSKQPQPAKTAEQEPVAHLYRDHNGELRLNCIEPVPYFAFPVYTAPQPAKTAEQEPWTPRELELIDGMIEVQLNHAERCDHIANRTMAEKQKGWDMERVALLRKIRDTAPPAPRRLTDEEIEEINVSLAGRRDLARMFARAIEARILGQQT